MSSNIPTRRITRASRTGVINNNKENALAKHGRTAVARAKPPSATDATGKPAPVRATASTAATRAKAVNGTAVFVDPAAQGKRKREALGEVPKPPENRARPANGTGPGASALKGKERVRELKEKFDGVIVKTTTTKTTTTVRQPLRHVGGTAAATTTRRLRSAVAEPEEQQPYRPQPVSRHQFRQPIEDIPEAEDAMAVDPEPVAPVPSPRRFVAARQSAASLRSAGRAQPTPRASIQSRRSSARHPRYEDEEESSRAFKKRRTSSDAPEEAEAEVGNALVRAQLLQEADPNGDEWDDLDAEDLDDPLMVSEYVVEIFEYLKGVEQTTMPNPNYMENQKDLAWKMRGILTDWLIQVHSRFKLLPETLFLCINIIDRFLSARVVSLAKLQLVGITCMFIAAKVEEIVAPSTVNFLYCADASYKEPEILQAERYILKTIDWNLSYPNPIHFLRRISKADDYNIQVRTTAKYFLEIQCLEWRLIAAPPSLLAAASVWLSRLVLGFSDWTPNLAHYSSYPESALIPTANLMLNYVLKPVRHQSFYKKYASKKYMKASVFVREWALSRWHEGSQVSLHHELPELKALIVEAREREERAMAEAESEAYEIV